MTHYYKNLLMNINNELNPFSKNHFLNKPFQNIFSKKYFLKKYLEEHFK